MSLIDYVVLVIIAVCVFVYMYVQNLQDTKKELEKQVKQKQAQIVQEKTRSNIKAFEARQKAKKEVLKKQRRDKNESKIDTSYGSHALYF